MRSHPLCALALAILLLPSAAAWRSQGQSEPSTARDAQDGFMWLSPHGGAHAVYFNAFEATSDPGASPNVAALGSRVEGIGAVQFQALLGVWQDCNGDGYVGLSETGATEYRAEVPHDRVLCPAGSAFSDGQVIHEMVSLGTYDPCAFEGQEVRDAECGGMPAYAPRPGVLPVAGVKVWGDRGVPGASGYEGCNVLPIARGTDSRTGKMLRYADCAMQHGIIDRVNEVDADCGLHLCMDPDHPDESDSLLNQDTPANLFGSPYTGQPGLLQQGSGEPTATAWDCQRGGAPSMGVAPSLQGSSLWDAAAGAASRCDPATQATLDSAYPLHAVEAPVSAPAHESKSENDLVFRFDDRSQPPSLQHRGFVLLPFHDPGAGPEAASVQGPSFDAATTFPVWTADEQYLSLGQTVNRNDLQPQGSSYWTVYASVPASGLDVELPGSVGAYGSEACAAIGRNAPDQGGWTCDPAGWWRDAAGSTRHAYARGEPLGATPGDTYNLRDVDCDDGALVAGTPASASLAGLSERGPCA